MTSVDWIRCCVYAFKYPLSCEGTFITLHFIDEEMEVEKASEYAQGY